VVVGADRVVRCVKLWLCFMEKAGLLVAGPEKHALGLEAVHCGIRHHSFFGLQIIPDRKALLVIAALTLMLAGQCTQKTAHSCLGLLEHCRYATGLISQRLYALWACFHKTTGPESLIVLDPLASRTASFWITFLQHCNGSAVATVRDVDVPREGALEWHVDSDAALQPRWQTGLGGFLHGFWWKLPYDPTLEFLTIGALELFAAGLSLEVLYAILGSPTSGCPTVWVYWNVDALTGVFVLHNHSAQVPILRHIHACIQRSKAYQYLLPVLILCHKYGPANVAADAVSRGLLPRLRVLCRSLQCQQLFTELPPAAWALVAEVSQFEGRPAYPYSVDRSRRAPNAGVRIGDAAVPGPALSVSYLQGRRSATLSGIAKARLLPVRPTVSSRFRVWGKPAESILIRPLRARTSLRPVPGVCRPYRRVGLKVGPRHAAPEPEPSTLLLADRLSVDHSEYALCRAQPERLQEMCGAAQDLMKEGFSFRTNKSDEAAFARWCVFCRSVQTTPWRNDVKANLGIDPLGNQRETLLMVNFIISRFQCIKPRAGLTNRTSCKPESAVADLRAVRRVFKKNLIPLASFTPVIFAIKGLTRRFIKKFGQGAMTPNRAAPFTNAMITAMFMLDKPVSVGPTVVDWDTYLGLNLRVLLALATTTGMRLSEIIQEEGSYCLLRSNISFIIAGVLISYPSDQQLRSLTTSDSLVIIPPPSKADQFGIVWGSLPIYVPYRLRPGNAVALVAGLILHSPDMLPASPLLRSQARTPLTQSFVRRLLPVWLAAVGVPAKQLPLYRWHSARVFLACALLAAKRSPEVIQALLRWQSAESLRLYACLNPAAYAAHLDAAAGASVQAIRTAHIPFIDSLDLAYHVQGNV
jgi:hypothetical protein